VALCTKTHEARRKGTRMFGQILDIAMGWASWGALVVVPGAIGIFALNAGMGTRTAGLLAGIGFALVLGWNARGVLAEARASAELRAALSEKARLEDVAASLVSQLEEQRAATREEVDNAIEDIRRASADVREERGVCRVTPDELNGLRRAFGYIADETPS